MIIFNYLDYREIIRKTLKRYKKTDKKFTLIRLAQAINVQNPYVSKVLNGTANFNSDQLFLICKFLSFSSEQTKYMFLLLEHEKSILNERKKEIMKEINVLQNKYQDTVKHIKAKNILIDNQAMSEYYLDPLIQIVHICLTLDKYRKNTKLLADKLNLSKEHLLQILNKLEKVNIIRNINNEYKILIDSIHLPKSSHLSKTNQSLLKIKSIDKLHSSINKENYSFAVTFSTDFKTKNLIQSNFLSLVKKIEKLVKNSQPQNVYQLNFDLFSWLDL